MIPVAEQEFDDAKLLDSSAELTKIALGSVFIDHFLEINWRIAIKTAAW